MKPSRLLPALALAAAAPLTAQFVPPLPRQPLGPGPVPRPAPAPGQTEPPPPDRPPDAPPTAAARGGVGIGFQPDAQGRLVVNEIAPGGPAQKARVPVGAILRAVDRQPIDGLSFEQVRDRIQGPIGSTVVLTLETEREVLDVVVQRAALGGAAAAGAGPAAAPTPGPAGAIGDLPAWLRTGARAIYFAGTATLPGVSTQLVPADDGSWVDGNGRRYREDAVPSTGGGGLNQYDFVHVAPDCIAANLTSLVYADAGLQTVTRANVMAMVGDANGLADLWLPPAKLRAMAEQESPGQRVRRTRYPLLGRTFDAIVVQTRADSGYQRYTYDLDTGLMLVFSASSTGAAVLTPNGDRAQTGAGATTIATVMLRDLRQLNLPWADQRAPQWLQDGQRFVYTGTLRNSLAEGLPPWRYEFTAAVQRRAGPAVLAQVTSSVDYGTGQAVPLEGSRVYGPGTVGNLWLDPSKLQGLQAGTVIDRDPTTGWQIAFVGSDGRHATIAEQGPLDQQSYTYDLQSGMLVATASRQQQGPATIAIDLQLAQSPR
ncbi:MAG: PDZ domain-containing protein [Planctomycetes bacterium]|nr:PDZ domain-containing protein [Planctomycetota bacterium]